MKGFAGFLRQDLVAVIAGLTLPWNSGVVEGHVNRVKHSREQCTAERRSNCYRPASSKTARETVGQGSPIVTEEKDP